MDITLSTSTPPGALVTAVQEIHTYKQMQAAAYARLAGQSREPRTRNLLDELRADEAQDAQTWAQALAALTGGAPPRARLLPQRVRLMMAILGARGFLEWALIAEDEAVEALAIQAGNLVDSAAAAHWTRVAADERLHVARIKTEVLGMEAWEMGGGGGVRDVIFGANDGLVSVLALVAGMVGAISDSRLILLAGVAGAVAGTVSMGAGAYVSSKSEQEVTQKEQARKRGHPVAEEQAELVDFYAAQGMGRETAVAVAKRVATRMAEMETLTIGEETGLTDDNEWPPSKAGLLTGLSFCIASLIPVLPFLFLDALPGAIVAICASVAAMFLIGASKAIFTRQSWQRSGLEVMVIGVLASIATFIIGKLIPI